MQPDEEPPVGISSTAWKRARCRTISVRWAQSSFSEAATVAVCEAESFLAMHARQILLPLSFREQILLLRIEKYTILGKIVSFFEFELD